jgi:predicted Zn-dependent protease
MRKLIGSIFAAVLLVVAPALAETTLTNEAAQVTISVPKGWKSQKDGEAITLMDKEEDTAVAFAVVDAADLKLAGKRLEKYLAKKVKKLTWEKEEKVTINGMKGVALEGDGRIEGKDVDLAVLVLDTPNPDKDLFVIGIAEDDVLDQHKDEIKYIFKNIKPAAK